MKSSREKVVIVGGAILGTFCAWSLRQAGFSGDIVVVEKDKSYQYSSTTLSAACIRLQFANRLNIQMSLYGVEVLRDVKSLFGADTDIGYTEHGYLILGDEESTEQRRKLIDMQRDEGADIEALDRQALSDKFPMMDFDSVGIGGYGLSGEGWFDAYSLMGAVRRVARSLGVTFLGDEVDTFKHTSVAISAVVLESGETLPCDWCILSAGAWSGALMHKIGVDLPVEPRKRSVFSFKAPVDGAGFPMLFDTSGIWMRPEGEGFIGGMEPPADEDVDATGDFEPHHHLMEDHFWPALATRIPAMEELRFERSWAGHYEVNTLDHNGIIGPHGDLRNLIYATGFSGHGIMHAPAAARGVAELITSGNYQSLDLSPMGWERIAAKRPLGESVII